MTNQRGSEMTPRGRVCTLGLREMRVSGNRFPTTGSLHGLHNCKVHLEVPRQAGPLQLTEMNRPWTLVNVELKQM